MRKTGWKFKYLGWGSHGWTVAELGKQLQGHFLSHMHRIFRTIRHTFSPQIWEENAGASHRPTVADLARWMGGGSGAGFFPYFPPLKPRCVLWPSTSYILKNMVSPTSLSSGPCSVHKNGLVPWGPCSRSILFSSYCLQNRKMGQIHYPIPGLLPANSSYYAWVAASRMSLIC